MMTIRPFKFASMLGILTFSPLLFAQAFVPNSADFVVETLPSSIVVLSRELAHKREATETNIDASAMSETQLASLEQQALAAYRIAVSTQEQRAYGHTLAILEQWPNEREKTANIHILFASVLQHEHHFLEALSHLDAALIKAPNNAQAWLSRAQINLVIADYGRAREDCQVLSTLVKPSIGINCLAQVDALTGNALRSLTQLENLLNESRDLSRQDYAELFMSAASFAQRLGEVEDATLYYVNALQIAPTQSYVLVNYAQLLLEQSRYLDVIALFAEHDIRTMPDEQLILYARALLKSSVNQHNEFGRELKTRLEKSFQSAFKRQEALPNKSYAQFALYLSNEPQQALTAARANWELQKEPSDTLLLALAAEANAAHGQIAVLARWVAAQRTEDVRLDRIFGNNKEFQ